jgi:uncharacterized cofD-like protein
MPKKKREKIVVIGGGTGSYNVLRGLKHFPVDLTAVVTMMDSGGSTGRLRDEFGVLPPGDLRRCLLALSSETGLLRSLFEYRFSKGRGLNGHSFGNLFLTVLRDLTGSDAAAVREAAKLLSVQGQVLPVTLDNCQIGVVLENGQTIVGETNINVPKHDPRLRIKSFFIVPRARINKEAEAAIREADKIVIGPGDLYTSLLANILVTGVPAALRKSKARVIYVCNIMTKAGETLGFKASDFVAELERHLGRGIVRTIVCNDRKPPARLMKRYAAELAEFVEPDLEGKRILKTDLLGGRDLARHDPEKLGRVLMSL